MAHSSAATSSPSDRRIGTSCGSEAIDSADLPRLQSLLSEGLPEKFAWFLSENLYDPPKFFRLQDRTLGVLKLGPPSRAGKCEHIQPFETIQSIHPVKLVPTHGVFVPVSVRRLAFESSNRQILKYILEKGNSDLNSPLLHCILKEKSTESDLPGPLQSYNFSINFQHPLRWLQNRPIYSSLEQEFIA